MIIKIKVNEAVTVTVEFEDLIQLQEIISQPDFIRLMKNQINFMSYLEMNDPVFMDHVLSFFNDNDHVKFRNAVENYEISVDHFIKYFSYAFSIPLSYVSSS